MKREVCFLIGRGGAVLWADVETGTPGALPDTRDRWEAIWELREDLDEIAHSHPMDFLGFSHEDETTMLALDKALGRKLRYSVVTRCGMIARVDGVQPDRRVAAEDEPFWADLLRAASGME